VGSAWGNSWGAPDAEWVSLGADSDTKQKITALSTILETFVPQLKSANLPADAQVITELERAQLVAVLETMLALLKSPMVEKGLFKRAADQLKRISTKSAEKKVEEGLGTAAGEVARQIFELIASIFK
jgi:hypothetical protein